MGLGLVSGGFLIDPLGCFPLVINGLMWYFPNRQATQSGSFLTFMRFLGVKPLLDDMGGDLKLQCFSLWLQTEISLSSRPKMSSVDHRLDISSLMG